MVERPSVDRSPLLGKRVEVGADDGVDGFSGACGGIEVGVKLASHVGNGLSRHTAGLPDAGAAGEDLVEPMSARM